ncbi:unnamed protein product [Effrenium voratum]|nr:unnamed protein product [Effrenium voratum]
MLDFPNLDLSPFDRFGLTPLDDAIRHEHLMVQRLLKQEGAQMGKVEFGVALCKAAAENDHNKIRQMIEAGVRAGMADYDYRSLECTALHLAASNGHLETCVFLLREGKVGDASRRHTRVGGAAGAGGGELAGGWREPGSWSIQTRL